MTENQKRRRGFSLTSSNSEAVGQPCKGFSLVESAIVLAVVGLVVAGIWVAATAVNDNLKVSQTESGLVYACNRATNVFPRNLTPESGGEFNITNAAVAANVFPSDWVNGDVIKTPIGSDVLVSQHTDENYSFYDDSHGVISIYFVGVPQKYCRRILPIINSKNNNAFAWVVVGVGGYDMGWNSSDVYQIPYSGNLSDACSDDISKIEFGCAAR